MKLYATCISIYMYIHKQTHVNFGFTPTGVVPFALARNDLLVEVD